MSVSRMVLYIPVGAGAGMSNILCTKEALSGGNGTWKSSSVCCFSYSSLYPSLPAYLAHTFIIIPCDDSLG